MRDLTRQRIEWLISSQNFDLFPEALRDENKSVGEVIREACRELIDETDRLEQRLRIAQHEVERSVS